jgi:nucleotide-binding universal stress UspA family protein
MRGAETENQRVVLVALDGSPAAAAALPVARALAAQLGAELAVLHVLDRDSTETEAAVRQRLALDTGPAPAPKLYLRRGEPAEEILRAAAEPGVAMVVLATHGRVVEIGRGLGRTAEAVVAGTDRPVLLVRPEAVGTAPTVPPFTRLLVPLDGTPGTAVALQPVVELAERLNAAIDLLFVVDPNQPPPGEPGSMHAPQYLDQPQHEWPQWVEEFVSRLACACAGCRPGTPITVSIGFGDVGQEVARAAVERQASAIVLVRRSRLQAGRAPRLRAILANAPCPVIVTGGPEI